ncbi:sorting nexin-16 isoform X2 [Eucyclogobius newberryi]|uniref:sorting nexin-16 isoform X2 n=1 Tax=Eucyclogobius newberryi TaxID=166745 RepID=UPI003B59CE0F
MAAPFVPVPLPLNRSMTGSKARRPQRASSLGGFGSRRSSRSSRSRTPPPAQSPVLRARVNCALEPSVEFSACPRSVSDPERSPQTEPEERPITPTVLGYEVMEERAKFTVYKVLVRKSSGESWVVFRRYADFSRLNDKLKEMFPGFRLALPPKRWFKDNYDSEFLEERQLGLQAFLQNLVAHKDIAHCQAVREFLCLDDPPGPFDSLEESRAFCETLEESNYRLQKEVLEKQKEITLLKKQLEEKERAILLLETRRNGDAQTQDSPCVSVQGSDSSTEVESSAAEADQDLTLHNGTDSVVEEVRSSACWCGPSLSTSPPVIEVTQLYHQP